MNRAVTTRDAWHPQTREDREAVLFELQEVLASPHFCNSKRYPALLQYITEKTLAGESDLLKERTLGIEVFDRPPSYDTNTDTVVRYTAGEVRKRLSLYYHELEDRRPRIQIALPAGSYVPEFLHAQDGTELAVHENHGAAGSRSDWPHEPASPPEAFGHGAYSEHNLQPSEALPPDHSAQANRALRTRRRWRAAIAGVVVLLVLAGVGWRYRTAHATTPLDTFWAPALRGQSAVMVCTGGSVFSQSHTSGVNTAGKDIEYPFVSMQSASAIASISGVVVRGGATTQLQAAASTPLTELRDRPVILLGGYNNQWTMRLLAPLPFHFTLSDGTPESIIDSAPPYTRWERDPSQPYSSADDYALVARFRTAATDSWVVVLAGIGRNGTEAAAQFATSPHYMQMLRDRAGGDFTNRNVEAVLKVNVVDGKTGAPSILAVHVW